MDVIIGNCLKAIAGQLAMLADLATDLLAASYLKVWLFSSNTQIQPNTDFSTLTLANYSGYAPVTIASFAAPALDATGNAYMATPLLVFQNNGGGTGNNIYSAAIMRTLPSGVAATGTAVAAAGPITSVTITAAGSGYKNTPNVVVTGDGTGGVVTATVVGGVVTALTITNPGSGYTHATLAIDPPLEMIAFTNLLNPRPMNVATDQLPLVMQINQAA